MARRFYIHRLFGPDSTLNNPTELVLSASGRACAVTPDWPDVWFDTIHHVCDAYGVTLGELLGCESVTTDEPTDPDTDPEERPYRIITRELARCEELARDCGWQGPWSPEREDLDWITGILGRKLTDEELQFAGVYPALAQAWAGKGVVCHEQVD